MESDGRVNVDSYLEIFTTLFGWMFYGVLWDVLTETGVVYLPFLGILLDNWREPAVDARIGPASTISLRRMEFELYTAFLVVVLAAQPASLTAFRANTILYTPPPTISEPNPDPVNLSINDSTFGVSAFVDYEGMVETPGWWFAVLAFSSGLNHAVIEGLPRGEDIRQAAQLARMVTLQNPALRQEVAQFHQDCYVPSRSKLFRETTDSRSLDRVLEEFGQDDVDWIGSHVFRNTHGYYDAYRATTRVADWPYDVHRDTEYDPLDPPVNGRPYCKEWWEHGTIGLRQKLIAVVNVQAAGYPAVLLNFGFTFNDEKFKDVVARTALLNRPPNWSNNDLKDRNTATTGWLSGIESTIKSIVSGAGIVVAAGVASLTITVLLQLLPILQALILLCIYALLPMLLVLSRYSLNVMISMGITIFSIKFWTVLWYLAQWVDQNLITAMYPDTNVLVSNFLLDREHGTKRILLNTATGLMYIGLPVLWTLIMGWAGVKAARSIESAASPYGRISGDAGQQGASLARKVA